MQRSVLLNVSVFLVSISSLASSAAVREGSLEDGKLRLRRQTADSSAVLMAGIRDFILTGGVDTVVNSPDKTSALMRYVQGYALRRVLGDGVVGQVIGGKLLGSALPATPAPGEGSGILGKVLGAVMGVTTTTTTEKPGFFDRLFGRNKNEQTPAPVTNPPSNSGSSNRDNSNSDRGSSSGRDNVGRDNFDSGRGSSSDRNDPRDVIINPEIGSTEKPGFIKSVINKLG